MPCKEYSRTNTNIVRITKIQTLHEVAKSHKGGPSHICRVKNKSNTHTHTQMNTIHIETKQ